MKIKPLPPAKYLRECFDYKPKTGSVFWRHRPRRHFADTWHWKVWNVRYAGTLAGTPDRHAHLVIRLGGVHYQAHRLIWKIVTGKDPSSTVDHEDCKGMHNHWNNLRVANMTEQKWNTTRKKNKTSGYRGVRRSLQKWNARIKINGVECHLGNFSTAKQASAAYEAVARKLHGKFYRAVA